MIDDIIFIYFIAMDAENIGVGNCARESRIIYHHLNSTAGGDVLAAQLGQ